MQARTAAKVIFTAKGETLTGKILVNDIGTAALILEKNSSGTGST
jgi:hypothetical protein